MNRTEKIQALEIRLNKLTQPKEVSMTDQLINEELENLRVDIGNRVSTRAIEQIKQEFKDFKGGFTLEPVFEAMTKADTKNKVELGSLEKKFTTQILSLIKEFKSDKKSDRQYIEGSFRTLVSQIKNLQNSYQSDIHSIVARDNLLSAEVDRTSQELMRLAIIVNTPKESDEKQDIELIESAILALEKRINSRISAIQTGGGNMNRQILVDGNYSTLGLYTDINLIPGSNMGITTSVDRVNQRTNFTFTTTGGGTGSGGNYQSVSGLVNAINPTFGYPSNPQAIIGDGITYFSGNGYSYGASVITMDIPPSEYIRAFV